MARVNATRRAKGGRIAYAGGNSHVVEEAEEKNAGGAVKRKHGGHVPHHREHAGKEGHAHFHKAAGGGVEKKKDGGKVPGMASGGRLDKRARGGQVKAFKRGGGVGSDHHPFSSAGFDRAGPASKKC